MLLNVYIATSKVIQDTYVISAVYGIKHLVNEFQQSSKDKMNHTNDVNYVLGYKWVKIQCKLVSKVRKVLLFADLSRTKMDWAFWFNSNIQVQQISRLWESTAM